ncbi:hypothetical protein M0804_010900 [Polistes exclamans]|nr:hypothetical protein M0804_010900 [Polistes exclamans]
MVQLQENMEDSVAVNGVVDVNGVNDNNVASDRIYYELDGEGDADSSTTQGHNPDQRGRSESPVYGLEGSVTGASGGGTSLRLAPQELPNEISAPYEVPQFPIEQIEKKLLIQRQLTVNGSVVNCDSISDDNSIGRDGSSGGGGGGGGDSGNGDGSGGKI